MNGQNFKINANSYITFNIGGQPYAIDASAIMEIKDFSQLAIHPNPGPAYLIGLCYFNDKMVPVIDLKYLLAQNNSNKAAFFSILFIQVDQDYIALKIAGLPNIQSFQAEEISSQPPESDDLSPLISGIIKNTHASYYIINPSLLTSDAIANASHLSKNNSEISNDT